MIGPPLVCHLCRQPLDLAEARTEDEGKAVHSECYATAIRNALVSNPKKPAKKIA